MNKIPRYVKCLNTFFVEDNGIGGIIHDTSIPVNNKQFCKTYSWEYILEKWENLFIESTEEEYNIQNNIPTKPKNMSYLEVFFNKLNIK
jgi:hypothetical protein